MLFKFELRPLHEVAPWPGAGGTDPHLHWFGLTEGWYWIDAGGPQLFRYSQPLVDKWRGEHAGEQWLEALPYLDYYVVRLWEDVLHLLPDALEPLPARVASWLGRDDTWSAWVRRAEGALEADGHDASDDFSKRSVGGGDEGWIRPTFKRVQVFGSGATGLTYTFSGTTVAGCSMVCRPGRPCGVTSPCRRRRSSESCEISTHG